MTINDCNLHGITYPLRVVFYVILQDFVKVRSQSRRWTNRVVRFSCFCHLSYQMGRWHCDKGTRHFLANNNKLKVDIVHHDRQVLRHLVFKVQHIICGIHLLFTWLHRTNIDWWNYFCQYNDIYVWIPSAYLQYKNIIN